MPRIFGSITLLRDASIRTKLTAGLGSALALVMVMGLLGLFQLHAVNSVTREIREIHLPQIETLQLIKRLVSEHRLLATRRTQTTNFHHLAAITAGMEETQKELRAAHASYQRSTDASDELGMFAEFKTLWDGYQQTLDSVLQRLEVGQISRALQDFTSVSLPTVDRAIDTLDQLILLSKQKSQNAAVCAEQVYRLALFLTAIGIVLATICAFAAVVWLSRNVVSPILRVSEAMRRLTAGDDTVSIADSRERTDEIGVLISAVSGYRDTLVRSRQFAAAAELERERLQVAVSNMPVGLCMFDREQRLTVWNSNYADIYRLAPEAVTPGSTLQDLLELRRQSGTFSEGAQQYCAAHAAAMQRGTSFSRLTELTDGRSILVTNRPLPTGGWVSMHEDVTELKRREASFRLLFENNPVPLWVYEHGSLRFIAVNEAAIRHYGYTREQFLSMTLRDIRPAEDQAEFDKMVGSPQAGYGVGKTWRHVKADGTLIEVGIFSQSLIYEGRRASMGAIVDITERKAVEQQLRQAQKMEAVGSLTGGLAHDFNNLLLIMIANLDLLAEEVADNPSAAEKVDTVLQSSLQGAELTRQMLAFSRRQPLQPKKVNIADLVTNTMRMLTRTLGEQIQIELRSSASLQMVLIDAAQLEAALVNVAINARDAMPNGGTLIIETAAAEFGSDDAQIHPDIGAGRYAAISVTDSGVGMTADVLARIFEPFFTTKAPGKGTGLGLSMVYGFLKQSGGHVTAYSEVGRGTTFRLYVPAAPESTQESSLKSIADDVPRAPGDQMVLAVDDNPDVRAAVVKQLEELGYRVETAENGETALQKLKNEPAIELLLTDVIMPGGMNGKELAGRARQLRPDLKVLFTSGFPGTSLSNDLDLDSHDVFLPKPYRKRDLARKIREVLNDAGAAA